MVVSKNISMPGTETAPTDLIMGALERKGWPFDEADSSENVIRFMIPTDMTRSYWPAQIGFSADSSLLTLSVSLTEGNVSSILRPGLYEFCNGLNLAAPGAVMTYFHTEGQDDIIELSLHSFVAGNEAVDVSVESMLTYMSALLKMLMPALLAYLFQRVRIRIDTQNNLRAVSSTVTPAAALEMMRTGRYGIS